MSGTAVKSKPDQTTQSLAPVEQYPKATRSEPKHYAIQTGLYLTNGKTGRTLALYICSEEFGGAWFVEEGASSEPPAHLCRTAEGHEVISLLEAIQLGIYEAGEEDGFCVDKLQLLAAHLRLAGLTR